jgi:hypothetical protein
MDWLVGVDVGNEVIVMADFRRPTGEADLDRMVGFPS